MILLIQFITTYIQSLCDHHGTQKFCGGVLIRLTEPKLSENLVTFAEVLNRHHKKPDYVSAALFSDGQILNFYYFTNPSSLSQHHK